MQVTKMMQDHRIVTIIMTFKAEEVEEEAELLGEVKIGEGTLTQAAKEMETGLNLIFNRKILSQLFLQRLIIPSSKTQIPSQSNLMMEIIEDMIMTKDIISHSSKESSNNNSMEKQTAEENLGETEAK